MNLIILKFAFRNIFLHRMKTFIIGSILVFGSFIAVLGNSLVDAISNGMKNSITQSVTGDIQIYSDQAKEKLSVFGNIDGSPSDIGYVTNFTNTKEVLLKNPNIRAVVPMGGNFAMMNPGNVIDVVVEKLRKLSKDPNNNKYEIESNKTHLKFLLKDLKAGVNENRAEVLLANSQEMEDAKIHLDEVLQDNFWIDFDKNYETKLEFIANKIAPLMFDDNQLFFSYLGTDIDEFKNNFPQFEIVKGQMVPKGEPGFLIHDFIYETFVKNRIARRLDAMKKDLENSKMTISESKELQDQIKANKEQLAELYLTMDFAQREKIISELKSFLKSKEINLRTLLEDFFNLNDSNFTTRFNFFYAKIAPSIQLYKINIGDTIPLTAMTKLGSSSATNIKVWGTFRFKSFENSPLAGNFSLIDLTSFRELYGFQTEARRKQNKEIESEMGVSDVGKDDIESLFGSPKNNSDIKNSPDNTAMSPINKLNSNLPSSTATTEKLDSKKDSQISENKLINPSIAEPLISLAGKQDVFINAAVFLKDPNKLSETITSIDELSKNHKLGIQAVDWLSASGIIGQMTSALRLILFAFVFILFLIASLMIMNSLLMATMERQQEIGTMRAIGAPKSFLYKVFLIETALTSLLFGGIGSGLAFLITITIGRSGLLAQGEVAKFFFSGPRLYFSSSIEHIAIVIVAIIFISFLATQYPAWRAMKISPLRAMQNRD